MMYHMVMPRKQVLVQLDDELVEQLDQIAERLGVSRSELLRRAATALLEADEMAEADRHLIESYRQTPQDPALVEAATRLAAIAVPDW